MAAGTLTPSSGEIKLDSLETVRHAKAYRKHVGLHLGGESGFYQQASVIENLEYFAMLSGLPRKGRKQQCEDTLQSVSLAEQRDKKVSALSMGMRQRLHLARALVHQPTIIILDEPTSGLDPVQAKSIRELISALRSEDKIVIVSTHQMSEAQQLADAITIINQGKIIATGSPEQILSSTQTTDLEEAYLAIMSQAVPTTQ